MIGGSTIPHFAAPIARRARKAARLQLRRNMSAVARARLMTISADTLLVDVAKGLSDTQISLVVVPGRTRR